MVIPLVPLPGLVHIVIGLVLDVRLIQIGSNFPISNSRRFRRGVRGIPAFINALNPLSLICISRPPELSIEKLYRSVLVLPSCPDIVLLLRVNCHTSSLTRLLSSRYCFCDYPSPILMSCQRRQPNRRTGFATARCKVEDFARVISSNHAVQELAASRACLVRIHPGGR